MPTHSTTVRYIPSPEGYRVTIPRDVLANGNINPTDTVGISYIEDLRGLPLHITADTENPCAVRSLSYEGESHRNAILTLPKQFVRMFALSGAQAMMFPARGGLVCQVDHQRTVDPYLLTTARGDSAVSHYSSGQYAIRIPSTAVETLDSQEEVGDQLFVWMATTDDGDLAVVVEVEENAAPPDSISVKANPSMVYKKESEMAFLFPIPVGDILFPSEPSLVWYASGTRIYAVVEYTN